MKITLREIPPAGLTLEKKISPEELDLVYDDLKCVGSVDIQGKVEKLHDSVLVRLHVKSEFAVFCARCLVPLTSDYENDFTFDYPLEKGMDFIEIGEDIRQEIIMGYATRVLCRPDCQGLCPKCGVNLNNEPCRCGQSK